MGICRFIYNNLITSSTMITISSLRSGIVSDAYKEGQGSAILNTFGPFTGQQNLEYFVQIGSTTGGNEVGQSRYNWRDSDTGWDATGVLTSSSSTDSTFTNGVKISFSSGTGNDFEINDAWYFNGKNLYSPGNLLDFNRDSKTMSTGITSTYTISVDLTSAKEVKTLVLYDHNFSSAATITLQGDSSSGYSAPYSTKLTWNNEKIIHYLASAATYRYWRVVVNDAANPSSFFELSEMFLGSYFEPAQNFEVSPKMNIDLILEKNYSKSGVRRNIFYNKINKFSINFPYNQDADEVAFRTIIDTVSNKSIRKMTPFFFNIDSTLPNQTDLVYLDALPRTWYKGIKWVISMDLEEALKK